jgi:Na+-driven multidrug efflux pump
MISNERGMTLGDLVPAYFLGSPVSLLLPAFLMHFLPLWVAFVASAVAGLALGLAIIYKIREPAHQRPAGNRSMRAGTNNA